MIDPVKFEFNGETYQVLPHTGFEAMDLDRKVADVFARLASRVDVAPDSPEYAQRYFVAQGETFASYSREEYRDLVEDTFRRVTVATPGKKNVSLATAEAVADHFASRFADLYNVMFEVWRANRFSPFAAPAPAAGA